ncbi:MAG: GIY-YIG nuclease family protein [Fibrobacter sp.]|nr:GIY-YIG nuclease family protein [Fibrobacter sp.]
MAKGFIYIFTNPSFPEWVKIGFAQNVEARLKQLNASSATPFAFRAYATYEVEQELTDKSLHQIIDTLNPDLRSIENYEGKKRTREFYAMSSEDAYSLLAAIAKISGTESRLKKWTPSNKEAKEETEAKEIKDEARKPPFDFLKYGIKAGSKLTYVNDKSIVVTVLDGRHVKYGNETTSISGLAERLMNCKSIQGTRYFKYKDEVLTDYRDRIDSKKSR